MREKIRKKGKAKKLFSVVPALAMVIALLPIYSITVYAGTHQSTDIFFNTIEIMPGYVIGYWENSGSDMLEQGDTLVNCINKTNTYGATSESPEIYLNNVKTSDGDIINGKITSMVGNKLYVHAHDFTYTASSATLTATSTCHAEDGCEFDGTENTVELTLTATSPNYSGIENLQAFNTATGKTIAESNVEIYKVATANTTTGGDLQTETPTEDGYYYASLTVEGQTAVKAFTIGNPGGSGSSNSETTPDPAPTPVVETPAPAPVIDETKLPVEIIAKDKTEVTAAIAEDVTENAYNLSQFKTVKGFAFGIDTAVKAEQKKNETATKKSTEVTVYTGYACTFGKSCIDILKNNKVDVVYIFMHKGHLFKVTIPAGTDITNLLDKNGFAGPLWIGKELGTAELLK